MIDYKNVPVEEKIKASKTISSIFKSIVPHLISDGHNDVEYLKAYDFFMDEKNLNDKDGFNQRISQMLKDEVDANKKFENYSKKVGSVNKVLWTLLFASVLVMAISYYL